MLTPFYAVISPYGVIRSHWVTWSNIRPDNTWCRQATIDHFTDHERQLRVIFSAVCGTRIKKYIMQVCSFFCSKPLLRNQLMKRLGPNNGWLFPYLFVINIMTSRHGSALPITIAFWVESTVGFPSQRAKNADFFFLIFVLFSWISWWTNSRPVIRSFQTTHLSNFTVRNFSYLPHVAVKYDGPVELCTPVDIPIIHNWKTLFS